MEDRFKFRVWDEYSKFMDYEIYVGDNKAIRYESGILGFETIDKDWKLMQCTGLEDKNSKLVFEGDILKIWIENCLQNSLYVVANSTELYLECNRDDNYYRINDMEVVGNIYENPELIKGD